VYDYVDAFSGAGGWDVGARSLGLHGLGIELNPLACATATAAGFHVVNRSVLGVNPRALPTVGGLIASPPCQEFSTAGAGESSSQRDLLVQTILAGDLSRSQATLGLELAVTPLRWAKARHAAGIPFRWIALEQVPPVAPIWDAYVAALTDLGYSAWSGVLCASQYGAPQKRRRAILLASLDAKVAHPTPHATRVGWGSVLNEQEYTGIMPAGRSSPGRPAPSDQPAPTVTAAGNTTFVRTEDYANVTKGTSPQIRAQLPDEQRYRNLTVEELSALQTFPTNYPWQGNLSERKTQIGNAVPPSLASAVLSAVVSTYRANGARN
jgi:DNA (cytosine-5)-methyltransferase 1